MKSTVRLLLLLSGTFVGYVSPLELIDENDIPELRYMNPDISPCDDFYGHVCDAFPKAHPLTGSAPSLDNYRLLEKQINQKGQHILQVPLQANDAQALKKAKSMYEACVKSYNPLNPELRTIDQNGGMPMLGDKVDYYGQSIWKRIGRLVADYGVPLLFTFQVAQANQGKNLLIITADQLYNPDYIRPETTTENYEDVIRRSFIATGRNASTKIGTLDVQVTFDVFLETVAKKLNNARKANKRSTKQIEKDIDDLATFTRKLYGLIFESEAPPPDVKIEGEFPHTIAEIQDWTQRVLQNTSMNWLEYLNAVVGKSGYTLTEDTKVYYQSINLLYSVMKLVTNTNPDIVLNFAYMRIFLFQAPDSDLVSRNVFEKYYQSLGLQLYHRSEYCTRKIMDIGDTAGLNYAVAHEYQKHFFNHNKLEKARTMILNITNAYKKSLENIDWMDLTSQEAALNKLEKMMVLLGFPKMVVNATAIDAFYQNLQACLHDNYQNAQNLRAFKQAYQFSQLKVTNSRTFWGKSALEVNAYYNRPNNKITVPIAILNGVFFHSASKFLQLSRLGAIFGHEITHGFDEKGQNYNEDGLQKRWWSDNTMIAFKNRTECFKNQYSRYLIPNTNITVNGTVTANENIADNGGLRQAYKAFVDYAPNNIESKSDRYTLEQLFFMSFATMWCSNQPTEYLVSQSNANTPYSPNKYRVNGVLANSEEFSRAFGCQIGAPMNPQNKCILW